MKSAKMIFEKLLRPPLPLLILIPLLSFAALIFIFVSGSTDGASAYGIYCMSAYSLTVWVIALPKLVRRMHTAFDNSKAVQRLIRTEIVTKYLNDPEFRGSVGIFQSMTVNFLYVIFRIAVGISCASMWFIFMAVYYSVLGGLRAYLLICSRKRTPETERRCCRRTAQMPFLLNIPMGIMIMLTVFTDSGYSYPGYVIYLSAIYAFYAMAASAVNLVKFRRHGGPFLSAAGVLNFVSAMMSILGLQTAMLSRFSEDGEEICRTMNAVTGGFVCTAVVVIAVYMLMHSKKTERETIGVE